MHDAKGRELQVGDTVLVPCKIKSLAKTEDFCNVNLETIGGRAPDGIPNSIGYINTKQIYRANVGDDTTLDTVTDNGKTFLR